MIRIVVENTKCKLLNLKNEEVLGIIDRELSYEVEDYQFMKFGKKWDGRRRLLTKNLYFAIGLLPRVKYILKKTNQEYVIIDNRPKLVYGNGPKMDPNSGFVSRDYQTAMVDATWKSKESGLGSGIIKAATGCHGLGQGIMMFDGSIKYVQDIIVGDKIMCPESAKHLNGSYKTVHELCRGTDEMYRVTPKKGKSFIVNSEHILSLKRSKRKKKGHDRDGEIIDVKLSEWLNFSDNAKHSYKLFRVPVSFPEASPEEEPYKAGLNFEKGISPESKIASRDDRLELLAGIIDAKGILNGNCFTLETRSGQLADDVTFISRGLGLAAYKKEKVRVKKTSYVVSISGHCDIIPNRIGRKSAMKRQQKKDVLVSGFSVERLGMGDYYGFKVDGDHRYLLDCHTVTHNSGKSFVISQVISKFGLKGTIIYVPGKSLLYQMKDTLEKTMIDVKVGIIGDGIVDIKDKDVIISTIWSAAAAFGQKTKLTREALEMGGTKEKTLSAERKNEIKNVIRRAPMLILDECQFAGSSTVELIHRESRGARHRFLFSATPSRSKSGENLLIEAMGGPKIFEISSSDLIDQGWLVKPIIYFLNVPSMRKPGSTYPEVYKNFIVDNDFRNDLIVKAAKQLVRRGRKVLILVTKVAHGKHLEKLIGDNLRVCSLDGKDNSKKRIKAISDLESGLVDIIISSKIFDTGIDIKGLDGLILAGGGKSRGPTLQRVGRAIRPGEGKVDAIIVDFLDNSKYLRQHSMSRKETYQNEPRFEIIMPKKKRKRARS